MNYRECIIFTGATFLVPENIARIDSLPPTTSNAIHGWQLRYGDRIFFSDQTEDGSGAERSLAEATCELIRLIHTVEAPSGLRKKSYNDKTSELPTGISGPIASTRKGRKVKEYNLGITIPRYGQKPTTKSVYIGTENTITDEKFNIALAKAVQIRNKAEMVYQEAKTKARRAATPAPESGSKP